ncbi:uncharacterized protein N7511_003381 [Penicillium nucicola]|uniref:uncharacterized protein n=1 Tax=Penicillium nucicola TaxID=1850975 RepID=UPI0025455643|nr:uncharacterized protein N7511_003381 [Penicillium nucicola]KAJ5771330.1 hypothetical protein N7511_003381 [Penicillium nucicola]
MSPTIQELLSTGPSADGPPTKYLDTVQAYNQWAEVYDTDGNFLQRLDTIEMRALLPQFLDRVNARFPGPAPELEASRMALVDLGCGTGRNTLQLVDALSSNVGVDRFEIVGLDASPGMLDVARTTIEKHLELENPRADVKLGIFDLLQPNLQQLPTSLRTAGAAGVISTLVLEHIPLQQYFTAASTIMKAGAYLLLTNMHAEMGMRSQAGFTDPATGAKIRPTSYCHQIADILSVAVEAGFQLEEIVGCNENGVLVRGVDEELGEVLGARAKKWVGIRVWFGICFSKK